MKTTLTLLLAILLASHVCAQDIELPAPRKTGGMPLMEALAKRSSSRAFDTRELSLQQLSDLTWAGWGITRPNGKRTAPSSHNKQEIELYLLLKHGAYIYDAAKHALRQVSTEDLRQAGGKTDAPLCIAFVGDFAKMQDPQPERKNISTVNSGFIGQNIYLYCASEGLATGYRGGGVDTLNQILTPKLNLRPDQFVVASQVIGYPKPADPTTAEPATH